MVTMLSYPNDTTRTVGIVRAVEYAETMFSRIAYSAPETGTIKFLKGSWIFFVTNRCHLVNKIL